MEAKRLFIICFMLLSFTAFFAPASTEPARIFIAKRYPQMKITLLRDVFRIKPYRAIGKDGEIVTQALDVQDGPVIVTSRF